MSQEKMLDDLERRAREHPEMVEQDEFLNGLMEVMGSLDDHYELIRDLAEAALGRVAAEGPVQRARQWLYGADDSMSHPSNDRARAIVGLQPWREAHRRLT